MWQIQRKAKDGSCNYAYRRVHEGEDSDSRRGLLSAAAVEIGADAEEQDRRSESYSPKSLTETRSRSTSSRERFVALGPPWL